MTNHTTPRLRQPDVISSPYPCQTTIHGSDEYLAGRDFGIMDCKEVVKALIKESEAENG